MSESWPHLVEVGTLVSYAGLGSTWNELGRLICWYIQLAEWEDRHPQTLTYTVTKTQKHTITNRDTEAQTKRHRHRHRNMQAQTHRYIYKPHIAVQVPCDKCCGVQGGVGKSSQKQA